MERLHEVNAPPAETFSAPIISYNVSDNATFLNVDLQKNISAGIYGNISIPHAASVEDVVSKTGLDETSQTTHSIDKILPSGVFTKITSEDETDLLLNKTRNEEQENNVINGDGDVGEDQRDLSSDTTTNANTIKIKQNQLVSNSEMKKHKKDKDEKHDNHKIKDLKINIKEKTIKSTIKHFI